MHDAVVCQEVGKQKERAPHRQVRLRRSRRKRRCFCRDALDGQLVRAAFGVGVRAVEGVQVGAHRQVGHHVLLWDHGTPDQTRQVVRVRQVLRGERALGQGILQRRVGKAKDGDPLGLDEAHLCLLQQSHVVAQLRDGLQQQLGLGENCSICRRVAQAARRAGDCQGGGEGVGRARIGVLRGVGGGRRGGVERGVKLQGSAGSKHGLGFDPRPTLT